MTEENQVVTPTPEPVNDLEARVKGFNEKMIPLLKEYELGLGGTAFITPDGRIGARPSLLDDRKPEAPKTPAPENVPGDASQADAPATEEPLASA